MLMLKPIRNILLAGCAVVVFSASAMACGDPANMTHVGVVAKVEGQALVVVDAQTGGLLTFVITADQATGLSPNSRVVIHYVETNGKLIAQDIQA